MNRTLAIATLGCLLALGAVTTGYAEVSARTDKQVIAWWSDAQGALYLRMFLNTRWMSPVPFYLAQDDASFSEASVADDGEGDVTYTTPQGPGRKKPRFEGPTTITDDIDPQGAATGDGNPFGDNSKGNGPP